MDRTYNNFFLVAQVPLHQRAPCAIRKKMLYVFNIGKLLFNIGKLPHRQFD